MRTAVNEFEKRIVDMALAAYADVLKDLTFGTTPVDLEKVEPGTPLRDTTVNAISKIIAGYVADQKINNEEAIYCMSALKVIIDPESGGEFKLSAHHSKVGNDRVV